jgi:hypothetical protein
MQEQTGLPEWTPSSRGPRAEMRCLAPSYAFHARQFFLTRTGRARSRSWDCLILGNTQDALGCIEVRHHEGNLLGGTETGAGADPLGRLTGRERIDIYETRLGCCDATGI